MTLALEAQKLATDPLVILFEVDLTGLGGSVLRLSAYRNGVSNIVFAGHAYDYVPVEVSGHSVELSGKITSPKLAVSSGWQPLIDAIETIGDIRGARVTWHEVFRKFLDTGSSPDPSQAITYSLLIDKIDTQSDKEWTITLTPTLGVGELDSKGTSSMTTGKCKLRYRTVNDDGSFGYTPVEDGGCPWGNPASASAYTHLGGFGTPFYDSQDEVTQEATEDRCSKTYVGCYRRFDPNGEGKKMPFSGVLRRKTSITGDKC